MERLTTKKYGELLIKYNDEEYRSPCFGCENINKCNQKKMACGFYKALEKLADYEDLKEQGKLLKLPCAVGDTVWYISERIEKYGRKNVTVSFIDKGTVDHITLGDMMIPQITVCNNKNEWITFNSVEDFDKIVFLTESAAEQALKNGGSRMTENETNFWLKGDKGLAPYLRMNGRGMPKGKVEQIAWLLLNSSGCGFCKVCRDEPCNIKNGEKCTSNIANYIRKIALEETEIQQYRKLGTVEELQSILVEISEGQDDVDDSGISVGLLHTLLEHAAYSELGTVEECREAVERQRGKKPIKITHCKSVNYYKCSLCSKLLSIDQPFCEECGNAVDWSE